MQKKRILFVCTFHGARSRIAEAFVNLIAPGAVEASSACFEAGVMGPMVIEIMREVGVDLPAVAPKLVFDRFREGEEFDCVVSLCNSATTEMCPVFLSHVDALYRKRSERISWSVPDFKSLVGSKEEKLAQARGIRDTIRSEVLALLETIGVQPVLG